MGIVSVLEDSTPHILHPGSMQEAVCPGCWEAGSKSGEVELVDEHAARLTFAQDTGGFVQSQTCYCIRLLINMATIFP